jgi:uncharacterized membrane protein
MMTGSFLLGVWRFLNTKYILEGIEESPHRSSFVVAGTFLSTSAIMAIFWLVLYNQGYIQFPREGFWVAVFITGLLNTGMRLCHFKAYGYEDLTLVSPIDALPPLFMVFSAWILLGELPNSLGFIGILIVVLGTYALNIRGEWHPKSFWQPFANILNNRGTRLALLATIFPIFSIVYDKKAVLASDPISMGVMVPFIVGFSALLYTLSQTGRKKISAMISFPMAKKFLLTGAIYALMLICFNTALLMEIVPYVGALKRFSILVDTLLAYLFLKQVTEFRRRYISTIVIVIGVIVIGVALI